MDKQMKRQVKLELNNFFKKVINSINIRSVIRNIYKIKIDS